MVSFREWAEKRLPVAEEHLEHCKDLLDRQRARVAERKQRGYPSRESEQLLKQLQASYDLHVRHVASLRRDLKRPDYEPPPPFQPPKFDEPPMRRPY